MKASTFLLVSVAFCLMTVSMRSYKRCWLRPSMAKIARRLNARARVRRSTRTVMPINDPSVALEGSTFILYNDYGEIRVKRFLFGEDGFIRIKGELTATVVIGKYAMDT